MDRSITTPLIFDYIVAGLILVLSVVSLGFLSRDSLSGSGRAVILVNLKKTLVLDLSADGRYSQPLKSGMIVFEVKNGSICVAESHCPRQTCRHRGWIRAPGETIVCLPQKVIVEIARDSRARDLDAMAY